MLWPSLHTTLTSLLRQVLKLQVLSAPQGNSSLPPYLTLTSCLSLPLPSGGLAAVIYTDALQTLIMLIGALVLMGYSKWGPRVTWVGNNCTFGDICFHHCDQQARGQKHSTGHSCHGELSSGMDILAGRELGLWKLTVLVFFFFF